MKLMFILIIQLLSLNLFAELTADWSNKAYIPEGENRANIYNLDANTLKEMKMNGYIHAENYPVSVTGLLIPYQPLLTFLNSDTTNPIKKLIFDLGRKYSGFTSEAELYDWLGLTQNNSEQETEIFKIPFPNGHKDNFYPGAGLVNTTDGKGLTFSCFTCHSQNMFGKVVIGLTNKRPRANKFFHLGKVAIPLLPKSIFAMGTHATPGEIQMYIKLQNNLAAVDTLEPLTLGLDTSLSQVALSLARRNPDAYATKSRYYEKYPRANELATKRADSKPMPWWNTKYKTRWLSDGSIVQGNPIFTNFLWNEIGRGTDLVSLEKWMNENRNTIDELTVAVFATEAPVWSDFFKAETIKIEKAKRGEIVFNNTCASCHGTYEKAWSRNDAEILNAADLIKTDKVIYHDRTPVKDVGTDSSRFQGMKYFSDALNNLTISKTMNTVVVPQVGYVPPPLVGIWMRYPYMHNNSIPNLCALLSKPTSRPTVFVQGPALNAQTDFDSDCIGYPTGNKIPASWWQDQEAIFDTTKIGMSNIGHFQMMVDKNGNEILNADDKKDLIEYLKTL